MRAEHHEDVPPFLITVLQITASQRLVYATTYLSARKGPYSIRRRVSSYFLRGDILYDIEGPISWSRGDWEKKASLTDASHFRVVIPSLARKLTIVGAIEMLTGTGHVPGPAQRRQPP